MKQFKRAVGLTLIILLLTAYTTANESKYIIKKVNTKGNVIKKISKINKPVVNQIHIKSVIKKSNKKRNIISMNFIVTHYTNSRRNCGSSKGISANGTNLVKATRNSRGGLNTIHYIATPKDVPFNTRIYIEKVGLCIVSDRGQAIKYKWVKGKKYMKIDLFVPHATQKELMKMGKYYTSGYILK